MATRAQMIADINASRPDPYAHLTEEQLLAMLNHTDPKLRDAARQILASRKPKESTTADLANETRPIPEVAPVDEGWKGGAFDKSKMHQEVVASRRREEEREAARRAEFNKRYGEGTYDYRGAAGEAMRNSAGVGPARPRDMSGVVRAAQIADLERQAAEEDAVRVHNARVAGLKRGVPASSPADLDPVEAAATEVTPDPQVGADMSSTDVLPGPRPGTVRKWNPTTKRYDIVDASKPVADNPAPFYGRTVPGPVSIDGTRSSPSELFASQEDAEAYDRRSVLGPDEAAPVTVDPLAAPQVNPRTGLAGSQRDIDMRRRGFVPVQGRDGNITYMLEADTSGETVGGPGRAGRRDDLSLATIATNGDDTARWETQDRPGPLGMQTVYVPSDVFRGKIKSAQEQRELNRLIETSGLPAQVVRQAYADGGIGAARAAANGAKAEAGARRREAVVRQAQLAQRPANLLANPTADEWTRRLVSEALLRSGRPGATPLDVQGQQMQNMQDIAKQLAVGALQAGPAQAQLDAAERARREEREAAARGKAAEAGASTYYGMEVPRDLRWKRAYEAAIQAGVDGATARRIADDVVGGASAPAGDGRVDGRTAAPAAPRENPF